MKLTHTNQSGVTLRRIEGYNVTTKRKESFWQHADPEGRQIGPQYPTRNEALSDTNDYVRRSGWMSA